MKHKDGILSATVVSGGGEDGGGVEGGKLLVKLQKGHLELIVDASCVEKVISLFYHFLLEPTHVLKIMLTTNIRFITLKSTNPTSSQPHPSRPYQLHMTLQANPPEYNRVENLGLLRQVNQSSLLNTLQHRFNSNLVHTFAGMVLISIPPPVPLRIYSTQV